MLPITALTAALLTMLYVGLSLRVVAMRRSGIGPSVGLGENERFVRAVRAHGNFAEYAPLFLILLGLLELQNPASLLLIGLSACFALGRIIHAIGFGLIGRGPWRAVGMALSTTALAGSAIALGVAAGNPW